MRILHTSDLHLGKRLHQHSLLEDQAHVLEQLVELVVAHTPDLFVVAGDVFDRSLPPEDAVALLGAWLGGLRQRAPGLPVVLIAGNHDSGKRLAWASSLVRGAGIHLRGHPDSVSEPLQLTTAAGEAVEVWALPFAWPGDVPVAEGVAPTQSSTFEAALELVRERQEPSRTQVLVAHCFARGGRGSDSERQLVGQATLVEPALFEGFDYVALGHLHRPQAAGPNAWYSGSPLAYSFSEDSDVKCALLVEVSRGRPPQVERLPLTPLRPLRVVETTLEALLDTEVHDHLRHAYLMVQLTERPLTDEPMAKIRARFPHTLHLRAPLEALPEHALAASDRTGTIDLASDLHAFWEHVTGEPPAPGVLEAFDRLRPDAQARPLGGDA